MFSGEALTIYNVEDYLAKFVGHVAPGQLSYVFLLFSSTYSVLLAAGGKKSSGWTCFTIIRRVVGFV